MRFFNNEKEPRRIEDHRPIVWEEVNGEDGPLYAGAQLTATPFGNVGRNIGYDVWLSSDEMDGLDFYPRLIALTVLQMSLDPVYKKRLRVNYSEKELYPQGGKPIITSGDFARIFKPKKS